MRSICQISPEGASAYQPSATPWVAGPHHARVLKERRIPADGERVPNQPLCGVPSERMNGILPFPRALPWAGMRRPVGAENERSGHKKSEGRGLSGEPTITRHGAEFHLPTRGNYPGFPKGRNFN